MTVKLTLSDIAKAIRDKTGLPLQESRSIADKIIDAMSLELISGGKIEIRGFGTFKVKERKARWSRNIRLGTKIFVPPRKSPSFTPGIVLKDLVNKK